MKVRQVAGPIDKQNSASSSGICVASSNRPSLAAAIDEIRSGLGAGPFQHILVFFSLEHDAQSVSRAIQAAFPGTTFSGCSTAGEIGPAGSTQGSILCIGFPKNGFHVHSGLIENIGEFGVEHATAMVRKLKSQLQPHAERKLGERVFGIMLVDGLSNSEEPLVAAVNWAFEDIQLIGGSAGDGLAFKETALLHDGNVVTRAAILILVESEFPFRVFKTQNFEPTAVKLVVTAADTENRIVYELNAEPAAREYAAAIGLFADDLGPFSFASHPLVVKVGGDCYCRSIRNLNPDGSLSFFCAIDEGLVFTVARPKDILSTTADTLREVETSLGGIDLVLGFDCVLRRLDAETHQVRRQLDELYCKYRVAGFHTYGEQYNAMHLNQTLTGIAFGPRPQST